MNVTTRRGLYVGLAACSVFACAVCTHAAEPQDGSRGDRVAVRAGYQMGTYSLGDADMDVAGGYLGAAYAFAGDWLAVQGTFGYNFGDSYELNSDLVSDFETVTLNLVLKPYYRIGDLSIYAKAGLNYAVTYYSVGWGSWSTSGLGMAAGAGASYDIGEHFGVEAEVLYYPGNDSIDYDGAPEESGGTLDYSPEIRLGGYFSF